jgi:DNA-binding NarL/FixJ family response regulator
MNTTKIRVLIVDDDAGLREALADTVRSGPDLEVVGSAEDTDGAVREAEKLAPDVVLMDVRIPGAGGVAATREVLQKVPEIKVVALSAHEDKASALQMLEAGAVA